MFFFINESGLYSLIIRSNKPVAKIFKRWVTSEVLPFIRKTESYSVKSKWDIQVNGFDNVKAMARGETKLHCRVVNQIRNKYPDIITIAGLGEYQEYYYQLTHRRTFNRL